MHCPSSLTPAPCVAATAQLTLQDIEIEWSMRAMWTLMGLPLAVQQVPTMGPFVSREVFERMLAIEKDTDLLKTTLELVIFLIEEPSHAHIELVRSDIPTVKFLLAALVQQGFCVLDQQVEFITQHGLVEAIAVFSASVEHTSEISLTQPLETLGARDEVRMRVFALAPALFKALDRLPYDAPGLKFTVNSWRASALKAS